MSRPERIAAGVATLLVAANLVALTLPSSDRHDPADAAASRARLKNSVSGSPAIARAGVRSRDRGRPPAGPHVGARSYSTERALRRAVRFAGLYARYRNHPVDQAGIRRLRSLASLELASTLAAQPPLGAGGSSPRMRVAGTPRLVFITGRVAVVDTALAAGSHRHRLSCVLIREGAAWVIVAFRYDGATVGM